MLFVTGVLKDANDPRLRKVARPGYLWTPCGVLIDLLVHDPCSRILDRNIYEPIARVLKASDELRPCLVRCDLSTMIAGLLTQF